MTYYEILDISISVGNKIDQLWNFFLAVHIGIIAPIAFYKERIGGLIVFLILLGYVVFSALNISAFFSTYEYFNSIVDNLWASSKNEQGQISEFIIKNYNNYSVAFRKVVVVTTHVITFALVSRVLYIKMNQ